MVLGLIELRLHLDSVFIWSWRCVLNFESVASGIGGSVLRTMVVLGIGNGFALCLLELGLVEL